MRIKLLGRETAEALVRGRHSLLGRLHLAPADLGHLSHVERSKLDRGFISTDLYQRGVTGVAIKVAGLLHAAHVLLLEGAQEWFVGVSGVKGSHGARLLAASSAQ